MKRTTILAVLAVAMMATPAQAAKPTNPDYVQYQASQPVFIDVGCSDFEDFPAVGVPVQSGTFSVFTYGGGYPTERITIATGGKVVYDGRLNTNTGSVWRPFVVTGKLKGQLTVAINGGDPLTYRRC